MLVYSSVTYIYVHVYVRVVPYTWSTVVHSVCTSCDIVLACVHALVPVDWLEMCTDNHIVTPVFSLYSV